MPHPAPAAAPVLAALLVLVGLGGVAGPVPAGAATASAAAAPVAAVAPPTVPATDVTTATTAAPAMAATPDIIPKPGSGRAPADAGERGGSLQTGLFLTICAAIAGIGALIWRDSRRARRRQGRLPTNGRHQASGHP